MTRKFKTAGVLMAVVAMCALTASSASATFTSANYPANLSGTSSADTFDAFGGFVSCTNNTFSGTLTSASTTLTVTPSYKTCTGWGLPATVDFTGCDYLLHNAAGATGVTVDLVCPEGKSVDITIYTSKEHLTVVCHVVVTPFPGKAGLSAHNSGDGFNISGTVGGITAHQSRTNFLCPAGTEDKAAKYTVQAGGIPFKGNNGAVSVS